MPIPIFLLIQAGFHALLITLANTVIYIHERVKHAFKHHPGSIIELSFTHSKKFYSSGILLGKLLKVYLIFLCTIV
jgi:hypothetical protein